MTRAALPRGSWDCHCHVFGPAARFPYAEARSYTPEDAPLEAYLALLDRVGFEHGVLVQPSAYGRDNRAMLDALQRAPHRLRGVGGAELTHFGLMAELGWHLQLWIDTRDLPEMLPSLARVPVPIVVDHMGRMQYHHGVEHFGFQALVRGVGEGRLWAKLSGTYRLGATPPDYGRAKPFHDALLQANPRNLVWGTDWPHPRPDGPTPDAQRLVEVFLDWTPDPAHRRAILVDNPRRLYQ